MSYLRSWIRAAIVCVGIALSSIAALPAQAQDNFDRRVAIANRSSYTIIGLYATNVGQDSWGRQILRYTIPPNTYRVINFNDGTGYCRFDMRVILHTGQRLDKYRVNVCEMEVLNIYD